MQGFGNVGGGTPSQLLHEQGCTVVGVSDVKGGVYNPEGLTPAALLRARRQATGRSSGYEGGETITNEELLRAGVRRPRSRRRSRASSPTRTPTRVKATVIVEAANGPTTPEADEIFEDRGILVVPDILANSGGVTVSYFEWVQDLQSYYWSEDEVNDRLRKIMERPTSTSSAGGAQGHDAQGRDDARRGPGGRGSPHARPLPLPGARRGARVSSRRLA